MVHRPPQSSDPLRTVPEPEPAFATRKLTLISGGNAGSGSSPSKPTGRERGRAGGTLRAARASESPRFCRRVSALSHFGRVPVGVIGTGPDRSGSKSPVHGVSPQGAGAGGPNRPGGVLAAEPVPA